MSFNFDFSDLMDYQFSNSNDFYKTENINIEDGIGFDICGSKNLNVNEILDVYPEGNFFSSKSNNYNACNEEQIDFDLVDEIERFFSEEKKNIAIKEVSSELNSNKKRRISDTDFEADNKDTNVIKEVKKSNKRPKRPKPHFNTSESFFSRIDNYWNVINKNEKYKDLLEKSSVLYKEFKFDSINSDIFLKNVIPTLLPNNIGIKFFDSVQGIDGWHYELNNKRQQDKLAMRWCGQGLNFYDPFVTRHKLDKYGKVTKKQALCPYCPVENKMNLDYVFHNTQDSLYMHHVCKDHGVYSSGYEMEPPLFFYDKGLPIAYCTECGEKCRMFSLGTGTDNCMIAYFRHSFISHNKKKQKRTSEQKRHDNYFLNNNQRKRFVFENFKYQKSIVKTPKSFSNELSMSQNLNNVVNNTVCKINNNIEKREEETNKSETVSIRNSNIKSNEKLKEKEEEDLDIVNFILEDYPEEVLHIETPASDSPSVETPADEFQIDEPILEESNIVGNIATNESVLINDVVNDDDFNFDFANVENEDVKKSMDDLFKEMDGVKNPFGEFVSEYKPVFSFGENLLKEKDSIFDGFIL